MEVKILENDKEALEIEFEDKTLPHVLAKQLNKDGVDAYVYEEHPLLTGHRLHINSADAMKKLKKALSAVEGEWSELKKELTKKH